MATYSNGLRRKVLTAYRRQEGSERALARRFTVSLSFVRDLLKRYYETGDTTPKPHADGRARKIAGADGLMLRACVKKHPDATLNERRTAFVTLTGQEISVATVGLSLRRLGFIRKKKTLRAREAQSAKVQFPFPCFPLRHGLALKAAERFAATSPTVVRHLSRCGTDKLG